MRPWVPPWLAGLAQARCEGCHEDRSDPASPGRLCIALTLRDGLCVACRAVGAQSALTIEVSRQARGQLALELVA